jgi:hypothetical protein
MKDNWNFEKKESYSEQSILVHPSHSVGTAWMRDVKL